MTSNERTLDCGHVEHATINGQRVGRYDEPGRFSHYEPCPSSSVSSLPTREDETE